MFNLIIMRYISLSIIALSLLSCDQQSKPVKQNPEEQLTETTMYDTKRVRSYLAGTEDQHKGADKIFLEAIDVYRNQKNPGASIALFKKSILLWPQGKAYYELGNAFLDLRGMKLLEAVEAYRLAHMLDYKPVSKLLYNTACAYALLNNHDSAFHYLVSAIEFGYTNTEHIYRDKDLASLREESYAFEAHITAALSGASDPDKLMWTQFTREFGNTEFPLVLDAKFVKKIEDKTISFEFERFIPEMRDLKFSRDVGRLFFYAGKIREGNDYKTLLYAVRDVMLDMDAPPYYYLVSYNNSGKLIDKVMIAGRQKLDEDFRVATLRENGEVEVHLFNIKYAQDPAINGFENNEMIIQQETGIEYYAILDDGKIQKKEQAPLAMR